MTEPATDLNHGLSGALGFEFIEVGKDRVRAQVDLAPIHQQPYGIVHGGVYCALIESVASVAGALWAVDQGWAGAVGVSNATDFFRSVRKGRLVAEATPLHRGRSQQLWQVVVTREFDDRPVARGQVRLHNLNDPDPVGGFAPDHSD